MDSIVLPEGFSTIKNTLTILHATAQEAVAEANNMPRPNSINCVWPLHVTQTQFCVDQDGVIELTILVEEADRCNPELAQHIFNFVAQRHPELAAYVFVRTEW